MPEFADKLNEVLKKHDVAPIEMKGLEDDLGRLLLLWEASVRLMAKLNHVALAFDTVFSTGPAYEGETVHRAKGGRLKDGQLYFCLNPDTVIVPINKSPTLAFFMIKRAAEALVDLDTYAQEYGEERNKCDEFEEKAAFEFTAFWEMGKAFRFKNNPTYRPHWMKEGN